MGSDPLLQVTTNTVERQSTIQLVRLPEDRTADVAAEDLGHMVLTANHLSHFHPDEAPYIVSVNPRTSVQADRHTVSDDLIAISGQTIQERDPDPADDQRVQRGQAENIFRELLDRREQFR